jgi:hypothetical protein
LSYLARLEPLIDVLVDALVREIESANESGPGSQLTNPQPVKDQLGNSNTSPPSR